MHQTKHPEKSLARIKLAMRVFFLSVLLTGNTFLFISTIASSQTFAQGAAQVSQQHMAALQPHALASAHKGLYTKQHTSSLAQKEKAGRQPIASNSSGKIHARADGPAPQDVSIAANVQGGPAFQVDQTLTFVLTATNISSTTTLDATSGVRIVDLLPLGLTNITATASSDWNIVTTATTSPSLVQALYTGPPVAPGALFSPVTVSGILTSNAVPVFTDTAGVADSANPNLSFATLSVSVSPSTQTVTTTTTPTAVPTTISDVSVSFNVHGGPTYQVGDTLIFDLIVTNISTTTTLDTTSGVSAGTHVPAGLSNITAGGSGWTVIVTAPNSPTVIGAIYHGPPVPPGGTFAPFEISATLNAAAAPVFTERGAVYDTQFPTTNPIAFSINVSPAPPTPTVIAILSPTVAAPPTVVVPSSPTVVVPSSPTVVVPSSPTVAPPSSPTVVVPSSPTVAVPSSPTVAVPSSPTVAPPSSPTATPPQLSIVISNSAGNSSAVGQTINYQVVVTNLPTSLAKNLPIIVQDILPVGLTNITASGNNWGIGLSSTTSPTLITATYIGPYPVAPGTILPTISISGLLTAVAGPSFTNAASVNSTGDPNSNSAPNTATQTITVLGSTASPTITATTIVPPTQLANATATTISGTTPNVSIVQSHLGGNNFHVGDTVSYVLIVSNAPGYEAVAAPIIVSDVVPLGLSHMKVLAPGWLVSVSDHSSPTVITATYNGVLPVPSGLVLPPILITGILNGDAVPSLTNTATVDTLGNVNTYNTAAIDTVFVEGSSNNNNNNDNHQENNNNNNNNNNDNHQENNNNNNNNNHQENNNNNNNNNNHQNNNNTSSPGLPATGSDPTGA